MYVEISAVQSNSLKISTIIKNTKTTPTSLLVQANNKAKVGCHSYNARTSLVELPVLKPLTFTDEFAHSSICTTSEYEQEEKKDNTQHDQMLMSIKPPQYDFPQSSEIKKLIEDCCPHPKSFSNFFIQCVYLFSKTTTASTY